MKIMPVPGYSKLFDGPVLVLDKLLKGIPEEAFDAFNLPVFQ